MLVKAASDPEAGQVIYIVDALDECDETGREQLIEALVEFHNQAPGPNGSTTKFLVTSRPYLDIERRFATLIYTVPIVHISGEKEGGSISEEIDLVIKSTLPQLATRLQFDESEQSVLQRGLMRMPHRIYIWLTLVLKIIEAEVSPTTKRITKIVECLRETATQAYETLLEKVKIDDRYRARKLLCLVVAAARSLTLAELNIALAIETADTCEDDLDLERPERIEKTVLQLGGLFVCVTDQAVYFIHQTAREFLLDSSENHWNHFGITYSEHVIAKTCVTYLNFSGERVDIGIDPIEHEHSQESEEWKRGKEISSFGHDPSSIPTKRNEILARFLLVMWHSNHEEHEEDNIVRSLMKKRARVALSEIFGFCGVDPDSVSWEEWIVSALYSDVTENIDFDATRKDKAKTMEQKYPYLSYAAGHWAAHYQIAQQVDDAELTTSVLDISDPRGKPFRSWFPIFWHVEHGPGNLVAPNLLDTAMVASYFGHVKILQAVLSCGKFNIGVDHLGLSSLGNAVSHGNKEIVELLLAAEQDDTEAMLSWLRDAIYVAASHGHTTIFRQLLETGKVEIDGHDGQISLLTLAAKEGSPEMVQMLVSSEGLDVNKKSPNGLIPLLEAARIGCEETVELLLSHYGSVDAKNESGVTALMCAAARGHQSTAKLLLKWDANINEKNQQGRTPLIMAVREARHDMVSLLIQHGAYIEAIDENGHTAIFHVSAGRDQGGLIELLIKNDANVQRKDRAGRTALSYLVEHEPTAAEALINHGAEIDSRDLEGRTPLSHVAGHCPKDFKPEHILEYQHRKHDDAVSLLIERGADYETKDKGNRTPLFWAVEQGLPSVIAILIEAGADINARTTENLTPLSIGKLSVRGGGVITRIFGGEDQEAKRSPDSNVGARLPKGKGEDQIADMTAYFNTNQALDDYVKNTPGLTYLTMSAVTGNLYGVTNLLDFGANVNRTTKDGISPLLAAAMFSEVKVAEKLLEHKAHVNFKDKDGRTPLLIATCRRCVDLVGLLISHNADPFLCASDGRWPMGEARSDKKTEVCKAHTKGMRNGKIGKALEEGMKKGKHWVQEWF